MYLPSLFLSLALGFLFANYCAWQIPAARRALSSEGPGTDFRSANKGLDRGFVMFLIACIPIGILGSTSYFYLTESAITYRPTILQAEKSYPWSELAAVETSCFPGGKGGGWGYSYKLVMKDGTKVAITAGLWGRWQDFVRVYPVLAPILARQSYILDSHDVHPGCPDDMKLILTSSPGISNSVE